MPWTRNKKEFCVTTYLKTKSFKTLSQPINIIMIYDWHKKRKKLHFMEAFIITIKNIIDLMYLVQKMHFIPDLFQMTTTELVSEINHYHINGFSSILRHTV